MLKSISWTQLSVYLLIALIIYYIVILLMYYEILTGSIKFLTPKNHLSKNRPANGFEKDPNNLFEVASRLAFVLKTNIKEAAARNLVREELILSFQLTLKQYTTLKGTAFQTAINNLIIENSKNHCSITLSDDELNMLWNG